MANANDSLKRGDLQRYWKDKLLGWSVRCGGVIVLFALLLIFIYLCSVIFPLFQRPQLSLIQSFSSSETQAPFALGLDEQNQFVYQFSKQGTLTIDALPHRQSVFHQNLVPNPSSFAFSAEMNVAGLADAQGVIHFYQLQFASKVVDDAASYQPEVNLVGQLTLGSQTLPISDLSFSENQDANVIAGVQGKTLTVVQAAQSKILSRHFFDVEPMAQVKVSADARKIYVLSGNWLNVYQMQGTGVFLRESIDVEALTKHAPVNLTLLLGGESVLVRLANGHLTQWFDVIADDRYQLKLMREFDSQSGVLAVESQRNLFANVTADGQLRLWHTQSGDRDLLSLPDWATDVFAVSFSPRADRLLLATQNQMGIFQLRNAHPDISIYSLWRKIWYPGYEQPAYVWQSTSDERSTEGKLGVVPLVFGTLKVAFFALIFALPLALGGAIYTAYFMPAGMRRIIKPSIEIMEALPTVILGFLAGVWLAPLIAQHLTGLFLSLILVPFSFLLMAFIWSKLSAKRRKILGKHSHLLVLLPSTLLTFYLCFQWGPWLEQIALGGDAPLFLSQLLDLEFEQRNALVIGIVMGFAVIPTIFTIAEDAIYSVPKHLTNGALALGATRWQTLSSIVLLTASPGIFSAFMMGLGRAVGETMIVLMATGNTPLMDWNIFEGMRSLAANIAIEMPESEVASSHYRVLFLTAFLLLSFTFVFNTAAEYVRQQLREKYRAL